VSEIDLMQRLDEVADDAALEAVLADVHVAGHALWRVHLRVHALEFGLRWRQGRTGAALWQGVAFVFAVPVSLVQRFTGLSRI
jgi:hypothetical protein